MKIITWYIPRKKEYILKIFSDIGLFLFYFFMVALQLTKVCLQSRSVRFTEVLSFTTDWTWSSLWMLSDINVDSEWKPSLSVLFCGCLIWGYVLNSYLASFKFICKNYLILYQRFSTLLVDNRRRKPKANAFYLERYKWDLWYFSSRMFISPEFHSKI